MGALPGLEWAAAYPDMVAQIVPVIGIAGGDLDDRLVDLWATPMPDPKWNGGDYYGKAAPSPAWRRPEARHAARDGAGLGDADLRLGRRSREGSRQGHREQVPDPAGARQRRRCPRQVVDANNLLYLVKANQLAAARSGEDQGADADRLHADRPRLPAGGDRAQRGRAQGRRHAGREDDHRRPERPPQRRPPHRSRPGRRSRSSWRSPERIELAGRRARRDTQGAPGGRRRRRCPRPARTYGAKLGFKNRGTRE